MSLTGRKVLVVIITKDIVEQECMQSVITQEYPDFDVMVHISKANKYYTNSQDPRHESYVNQYINCPENRNKARRLALASDADYFLFVDSDTVLPSHAISKLMLNKKDAVGGYYHACGDSKNYVAGSYQKNSKGQDIFMHVFEIRKGTWSVDMIGLGCALISRKLLEQVEFEDGLDLLTLQANYDKPWQHTPPQFIKTPENVDFELHPGLEEPKYGNMGECSAFGFRARGKGFKLWMDGGVEVLKHLTREGHYTTIPEVKKENLNDNGDSKKEVRIKRKAT